MKKPAGKLEYARILVQGGYSRRKMDAALRANFGESVGKSTYTKLYAERKSVVGRAISAKPRKHATSLNRQGRENWLIERYFTLKEINGTVVKDKDGDDVRIAGLASLKNVKTNNAIRRMVIDRKLTRDNFMRRMSGKQLTDEEFKAEWHVYLWKWFKHRGYVTKGKLGPKNWPSVWDWYHKVNEKLPLDQQEGYPTDHQRKRQKPVTTAIISRGRRILNLTRMKRDEPNPKKKAEYQRWIDQLRSGVQFD